LRQLEAAGDLSAEHVRLAASGLGVSERTVRRWLSGEDGGRGRRPGKRPYRLLSTTDLARALGWELPRVEAALAHAHANPRLGGPLALRRIPPETYTVLPRLDLLQPVQHTAVASAARYRDILAEDEATVLVAALTASVHDYLAFRQDHLYVEQSLKDAGFIRCHNGPHRIEVSDDILFSLRYRDDTHIAYERGEIADQCNGFRPRKPAADRWEETTPSSSTTAVLADIPSAPEPELPQEPEDQPPPRNRRRWRRPRIRAADRAWMVEPADLYDFDQHDPDEDPQQDPGH
jgi:hypothetical protein